MSELRNGGLSHDGRRTNVLSRVRNRAMKFATQADLVLARYPVAEREQIAELLHILAAKPGNAENVDP
jgi:hypothetical protein